MKIALFARRSNPSTDTPVGHFPHDHIQFLLATRQVQMISKRRAQYLGDGPVKARAAVKLDNSDLGYDKEAHTNDGREWRVVGQTNGFGPGLPHYSLVFP